ncbi:MAG: hypothetical protein FH758_06295 [Firmicutes bacterium]|nr:hypothetical protein [Bacillota bacterium]
MLSIHPARKSAMMLTFLLVLVVCTMGSTVALAEADSIPPVLEWSNPTNCQTDVPTPLEVVVCYFNENEFLDADKCNLDIITFKDSQGQEVGLDDQYGLSIQDNKLVITPKKWLADNEIYTIRIPGGAIKDHAGNAAAEMTIKFSTGETNPCAEEQEEPIVTTGDAVVSPSNIALKGNIVSNGGAAITEYGFEWSTDHINWEKIVVGSDDRQGSFTGSLGGLETGTTYYFRAYAVNSVGTDYGIVKAVHTDTDADTVLSAPVNVQGLAGEIVQVPITLKSTGDVAGLQFDLTYDSSLLNYQTTEAGGITPGSTFEVTSNKLGENKIRVIAYNPSNDSNIQQGEGSVALLTFQVADNSQPDQSCPLVLSGVEVVEQNANIISGVVSLSGLFAVADQEITPQPTKPTLQTMDATNITKNSAVVNGNIINNGTASITEYGFEWSNDQESWAKVEVGNNEPEGMFNKQLTNLDPETTYYFRAYAKNSVGTGYGQPLEFTTNSNEVITAPVVTTNNASSITKTSAILNGTIESNGGTPITAYGFEWSSDHENWTTVEVGTSDINGAFNGSLSDLNANTTYYYRAYATNEIDTTYGQEVEFKTNKSDEAITAPVVETNNASSITKTSATLNGTIESNGGASITAYGFEWSSDHENWTTVEVGTSDINGAFNGSLSDLNANTAYYYRAYATNEIDTTYGQEVEFKTDSAGTSGGGGGGGGGGSSRSHTEYIDAEDGGSLSFDGVTVDIPAGALEEDARFTIERLYNTEVNDIVPSSLRVKLCGDVYEITTTGSKDFLKDITICLPYDEDCIAEGEYAIVHYYDETAEQWIQLDTTTKHDDDEYYACVKVDHLTKFTVFSTKMKVINLTIGQLLANVDGNTYTMDVAPFVTEADRTLVPLRFISEALGAEVEWDPETRQVLIEDGEITIILTIESANVQVQDVAKTLDAPAMITSSRTFVPLRFVSETLGAQVDYHSDTKGITITR